MVTYLPRSAWGARASRGGTALVASNVVGEALHWPGMAKPINADGDAGMRRVASALRGWQNYHMDQRGWSDIAYQIAIDQAGRAWTLRGLNIRSGANGDANVNLKYGAFLLVLAPGERPSAAMIATTKAVILDFRKRFPKARLKPYGHRDVRPAGTDCPGPLAYAAIQAGTFTPSATTPTPPPPTNTEDSMSAADVAELKRWIEKDYVPRLFNASINGTAGKNFQKLEGLMNALIKQEADRYKVYYGNLQAILNAVKADDANDVTQADVDQILAKFEELKPVEPEPEPEAPKA